MSIRVGEQFRVGVNVQLWARERGAVPGVPWELVDECHNLVTTVGKELLASFLAGDEGTGITYCEIGTDATAATVADTALGASHDRNAITRIIKASNVVQFRTFFTAAEATALIKEVALFGGAAAGAGAGSGSMLNRAIVTFDGTGGTKDLTVAIQIKVE